MDAAGYLQMHWFIILTAAEEHTQNVVIVNADRIKPNGKFDHTVILDPGVHEFITSRSYINYNMARITSLATLFELIKSGTAVPQSPVSAELLNMIRVGLLKSDFTNNEVREFYRYNTWPI